MKLAIDTNETHVTLDIFGEGEKATYLTLSPAATLLAAANKSKLALSLRSHGGRWPPRYRGDLLRATMPFSGDTEGSDPDQT